MKEKSTGGNAQDRATQNRKINWRNKGVESVEIRSWRKKVLKAWQAMGIQRVFKGGRGTLTIRDQSEKNL